MSKLTPLMREMLAALSRTENSWVSNEQTAKALSRRGLAERVVPKAGHLVFQHRWRITPAGRAALAEVSP